MKATMVEYTNEYGEWTWFKVYLHLSPRRAIINYVREHGFDFTKNQFTRVPVNWNPRVPDYNFDDEVRAYTIEIDEDKP